MDLKEPGQKLVNKVSSAEFTTAEIADLLNFYQSLESYTQQVGLLALEPVSDRAKDKFFSNLLNQVINGVDPAIIYNHALSTIEKIISDEKLRHKAYHYIYYEVNSIFVYLIVNKENQIKQIPYRLKDYIQAWCPEIHSSQIDIIIEGTTALEINLESFKKIIAEKSISERSLIELLKPMYLLFHAMTEGMETFQSYVSFMDDSLIKFALSAFLDKGINNTKIKYLMLAKSEKLLFKKKKKLYFHLLAILLFQNGDLGLVGKLQSYIDKFADSSMSEKTIESSILDYINRIDGRILNYEESLANDYLISNIKEYDLAFEILSDLNPVTLSAGSLYNLAILHYLKNDNKLVNMQQGLEYSLIAAEKGNLEGAFTAGYQLLKGIPGFSRQLNNLLKIPDEKATILGFTPYSNEVTTEIDTEKALTLLHQAADKGHESACETLAEYYAEQGEAKKSLKYLDLAVDLGSYTAAEALGDYFSGKAESSHYEHLRYFPSMTFQSKEAIDNYKSAFDYNYHSIIPKLLEAIFKSDNPAQHQNLLSKIYGVRKNPLWDFSELQQFITSEEIKKITGDDFLGICYFGMLLRKDLKKAFSILERAYNEGRKAGYVVYLLGILHLSKIEGRPYDPVEAHRLFMEAADIGFARAASIAGKSCYDGGKAFFPPALDDKEPNPSGAELSQSEIDILLASPESDKHLNLKDEHKAEKYLKQAADAGFSQPCELLSKMYMQQRKKDDFYLYTQKSSVYGSEYASLQLAAVHAGISECEYPPEVPDLYKSKSVQKDYGKALFYCDLANLQGIRPDNHLRLAEIFDLKKVSHEVLVFINQLLQKASENGQKTAVLKLGFNYLEGIGCEKDKTKAMECLTAVNDGIQAHKTSIYDADRSTPFELELKRARTLSEIYGDANSQYHDSKLAEGYIQYAKKMEAEQKQSQIDAGL